MVLPQNQFKFMETLFNYPSRQIYYMKYLTVFIFIFSSLWVQAQVTRTCRVRNNSNEQIYDAAIVLPVKDNNVKGVTIYYKGKEIASQLDDLDQDGIADEIVFLSDFKGKECSKKRKINPLLRLRKHLLRPERSTKISIITDRHSNLN